MSQAEQFIVSKAHLEVGERPLVSVVLAVRNERNYIENALLSLMQQETPEFDLEILVVDGRSSDGTLVIVRRMAEADPRIRVLVNERQTTPFAFNLGLQKSRGEYICILGAHAVYGHDYLWTCLDELKRTGATACGGLVETWPANNGVQAKLAAWVLGHSFGSSTKSFRTRGEGFSDGVNFPLIVKRAVLEVGGYDEQLLRNQDNDMNQRLRARGHRLFVTEKTRCRYFGKPTLGSLFRYAFRSGSWNVFSFRKNRQCMGLRHFVPFCFVSITLLLFAMLMTVFWLPERYGLFLALPFFFVLGAHLICGTIASVIIAVREQSIAALILPFVFLGFHVSYGVGTLLAFSRKVPVDVS
jgi:succinoglycan biosynthesis protein ExoA